MFAGIIWGDSRAWALSTLGLVVLACSGMDHDCAEYRNCPYPDEPDAPIDVGAGEDWGNGGSAGLPSEPRPEAAGSKGESRASSAGAAGDGACSSEEPTRPLRRVSLELPAEPDRTGNWTEGGSEGIHNCLRAAQPPYSPTVCVGDDPSNVRYTGFLSFDLSSLPDGLVQISSARLVASATRYGSPATLGENKIEHMNFGKLDEFALWAAPLAPLGPFYNGVVAEHFELNDDLTSAVAEDYDDRVARSHRSQYRLSFAKILPDNRWDDIEIPTASIRLILTYLIP